MVDIDLNGFRRRARKKKDERDCGAGRNHKAQAGAKTIFQNAAE